jgi:hypothetical protein
MKREAKDLIFISQINRDGSGTSPVSESYLNAMLENTLMKDDYLKLSRLSISHDTYIAHGFNSFVVKLKPPPMPPNTDIETEIIIMTHKKAYIGYYDKTLNGYFRQTKNIYAEPIKINNVTSWKMKTS